MSGRGGRRRLRGADPGPRRLRESLDEAVADIEPRAPSAASLAAVFAQWDEIVGPSVAAHARPVELAGGTLVVAVDHPAWATQVRALSDVIRGRIGEVGGEVPGTLRVVVRAGPSGRM